MDQPAVRTQDSLAAVERPQASVESQPGEEPKGRSAAATVLGRKSSANHNYQRHPSNYDYRRQPVWWDSFFVHSVSGMCKRTHSSEEPRHKNA